MTISGVAPGAPAVQSAGPSAAPPRTAPNDAIVYVVDDDAPIRDALRLLMRSIGLEAQGFPSAAAFLAAWRPRRRACLVTDVRMPGMSGLALQRELRDRGAKLPIILITGHGDVAMAVRAMKEGAADFIEKPFDDQTLIDAVHKALHEPALAFPLDREEIEARMATLTPREREVMLLVAAGKPNKVVSTELDLSVRTVEVHRARVIEKMRADSLADLVRMAVACELLPV
jgi:FixJ family two-component response regulator